MNKYQIFNVHYSYLFPDVLKRACVTHLNASMGFLNRTMFAVATARRNLKRILPQAVLIGVYQHTGGIMATARFFLHLLYFNMQRICNNTYSRLSINIMQMFVTALVPTASNRHCRYSHSIFHIYSYIAESKQSSSCRYSNSYYLAG